MRKIASVSYCPQAQNPPRLPSLFSAHLPQTLPGFCACSVALLPRADSIARFSDISRRRVLIALHALGMIRVAKTDRLVFQLQGVFPDKPLFRFCPPRPARVAGRRRAAGEAAVFNCGGAAVRFRSAAAKKYIEWGFGGRSVPHFINSGRSPRSA